MTLNLKHYGRKSKPKLPEYIYLQGFEDILNLANPYFKRL